MKEISEIIKAFDAAQKEGRQTALATVVHVDGSSYRRPGARMLVTDEGRLTGAISGGCLEGDALRKALLSLHRNQSMLVTYDTNGEDDAKLGVGLGCNGVIQVLFEPIDPASPNNPIQLLKLVADKRQYAVLATLFSLEKKNEVQPGTCLLMMENGISYKRGEGNILTEIIVADAKKALDRKTSWFRHYISEDQAMTAFIEFIRPPVAVVIVGAGNDVIPVVQMADILGWETIVADGRPSLARQDRFAGSCQVLVTTAENLLEKIRIDEETVFLLMTHNYNYDLAILKELIKRDVKYIGSLGPRQKLDRMLKEIKEEGICPTEEQINNIYGPSGLEIGAETPEEIALSILSEIKAVLTGKQGGLLRDKVDSVHSRAETRIESVHVSKPR